VNIASAASAKIRAQDGAWVSFNPQNDYTTDRTFKVGSGVCYAFIGEVLVYTSALSDANVNLVGAYLANKWNFTWTDL
jgi:hypothetical protein